MITLPSLISKLIETQYQRAISLLELHKDKLTELATVLLDKEVIFKDNLQKIFGDRPFAKPEETAAEEIKEAMKDDSSIETITDKKE